MTAEPLRRAPEITLLRLVGAPRPEPARAAAPLLAVEGTAGA